MRKPSKFKYRDIQRAGKAMMDLGYELASLEIDEATGGFKIGVSKPSETQQPSDNDLVQWMTRHAGAIEGNKQQA
jgi:hypothetical protein